MRKATKKCARCGSPINSIYDYCRLCKKTLILSGELKTSEIAGYAAMMECKKYE